MVKLVRTATVSALLVGLILLGFWRLRSDQQQEAIAELRQLNADMHARLAARDRMIERLGRARRLAHVRILDQRLDPRGKVAETDLLFIELDDDGSELARQSFTIPGDVLFIDAWTVKFSHDSVATGHPLFGHALILLRRVYSDRMAPIDGLPIDTPGAIPPAYATSDHGRFEQRVWADFWRIAGDARLAESMGVRVAQGEAVYKNVSPGQSFALCVDATGGMSLTPLAPDDVGENAVSRVDG